MTPRSLTDKGLIFWEVLFKSWNQIIVEQVLKNLIEKEEENVLT